MKKINSSNEIVPSETRMPQTNFLAAEWLATLSHELRSPLAAIKGYATMLLRYQASFTEEEHREYLQSIAEGSDRIENLLDILFHVAEFESGLVTLHLTSVDIIQVIESAWAQIVSSDQEKQLRLILKKEAHDSAVDTFMIDADRELLQQMVTHLLTNAQKFSPEATPIEVSIIHRDEPYIDATMPAYIRERLPEQHKPLLELQVRDYGIGVPVEYQERIFDRFHKVNTHLTREEDGLGLGLTLCQYIVSLHHGFIWAESTSGAGSIFRVLLPCTLSEEY